LKYYYRTY